MIEKIALTLGAMENKITNRSRRTRLFLPFALSLLVMILSIGLGLIGPADAARVASANFCKQPRILHNYLGPVSQLPKAPGFAKSGRLRVGPASLRIYPPREAVVDSHQGRFEVRGQTDNGNVSHHPLEWWVISALERIDKHGKLRGPPTIKRQFVASVAAFGTRNFGFSGKVGPGFYRITVEIENSKKKRLARYQELFRALPPRSSLRLLTDFSAISPGQTGELRVDNYGSVRAWYASGYELVNSNGEKVPLEGLVFSDTLLPLHAGYSGRCIVFTAPTDALPGVYLIEVEVGDPVRGQEQLGVSVVIE